MWACELMDWRSGGGRGPYWHGFHNGRLVAEIHGYDRGWLAYVHQIIDGDMRSVLVDGVYRSEDDAKTVAEEAFIERAIADLDAGQ